jgi:hypothetical protein
MLLVPLKALLPILVTPSADKVAKLAAPLKALAPIDVIDVCKTIDLT